MIRALGLLIPAATFLAGCVADGQIFSPAPEAPSGQGIVYVYRVPGGNQLLVPAIISVDGKPVTTLHPDGYAYVYVQAGQHEIAEKPQAIFSNAKELDLMVPSKGSVYVQLTLGGDPSVPVAQNTVFEVRSPDVAAAEIFRRHLEPGAGARLP
ncbi:MAG TPA: hypothetical protein VGF97_06120 [Rhizomicrobium sp.]|jgi:hypothetical protein